MIFNVGPWVYRVQVVPKLEAGDGAPLMGRTDLDSMIIYLAADVSPQGRLNVILHELRHAWAFHFPRPSTIEEEADFSATIIASAMADFNRQGGAVALMQLRPENDCKLQIANCKSQIDSVLSPQSSVLRLVPLEQVESWQTAAPARAGRAQCGVCESIIPDGAIANDPPRLDAEAKGMIVTRTLYCAHCDHLQAWDEGIGLDGRPNGSVVRGPFYTRGAPVEKFLENHPEAAGMLVG